ncbi:MAG: riboflavin synthase [Deltaproteobacteria bacterium]|nr:MAG: riboflavin synthase [Deltaproteobacteria bacterium]
MFTGLVEDIGVVKGIIHGVSGEDLKLEIYSDTIDLRRGDSIAVNGCCLTVIGIRDRRFSVEVSKESRGMTTLGMLRGGDKVNLERAIRVGDHLGGHLVSGHIDGKGTIKKIVPALRSVSMEITTGNEVSRYLVKKGSVAIDGVSLTVNEFRGDSFTVNIIPYTLENTIFKYRKAGNVVNIESDLLGKYVEKFLAFTKDNRKKEKIGLDFLAEHGFR